MRPLGVVPYLYWDARYEKVRHERQVRDAAVLIASGVDSTGNRQILGISVALSEHEVHWWIFLQSLVVRGLSDVQMYRAMRMWDSKRHERPCWVVCPGNRVSSICNRTPVHMCRATT